MEHEKESWGFTATWASTKDYSGRMIIIREREETPYTYHKRRDKTIFVLQGVVKLIIEGNEKILQEQESYHIPPKIKHKLIALKGDATILEVGTKLEDDLIEVRECPSTSP